MKYKDTTWKEGPAAGETLAVNGSYTGARVGTPMQGKDETEANALPFSAEKAAGRVGTLAQDAADANFPEGETAAPPESGETPARSRYRGA